MKSTTTLSPTSLLPLLLTTLSTLTLTTASACTTKTGVTLTSYGSGSTPGKIVYPNFACAPGPSNQVTVQPGSVQGGANSVLTSGDGSYNNPATMATALDNPDIQPCAMVYVPWLRKYFKFADRCEQCTTDLASGLTHLDLWTGPPPSSYDASTSTEQGTCESKWGSSTHSIVLNPGPSLPVSTDPMDDGTTCYSPLDATQHVFDEGGDVCSGGSSSGGGNTGGNGGNGGSSSAAAAAVASPTAPAAQGYTAPAAVVPSPSPSPSPSSSAAAVVVQRPAPNTFSTVVVPSPSSSPASSSNSGTYSGEKDTVGGKGSSGGTCSTYNDCNPGNNDVGMICVCGQCVSGSSSDFSHCKMYGRGLGRV